MRFWTAYAFLALTIATKASAAAGGAGGSLTDLIAPTINVAILFGVLIWKIKGPLKSYFDSRSEDVANTLERASLKSKEAALMLENQKHKMANLETELKNIHHQSETDLMIYEKNLSKEIEDKSHKLKTDANSKIQADKKSMLDELNAELLDQVIKKTKSTIKENKEYQGKVSSKLLSGL
jgi:F0F1-type ATP synthase membrane subunit b/b'